MKRMLLIVVIFSFMCTSGCITLGQGQNRLQEQVSFIHQEQKTQAEIQHQIQNRLMELEKVLQEIDKKLSVAVIQNDESIPSNQGKISTLTESKDIKLASLIGTQEVFQLSLDEVARGEKENTKKIDGIEQRLTKLEREQKKTGNQREVYPEKKTEVQGAELPGGKKEKPSQKHENVKPDYLYEKALEAFNKQEYDIALALWDEMADNFPEHKLVSNAYFWQGEACYQLGDFDKAVLKYNKVIEKYPRSSKYSSALLKIGLSFYALNKSAEGRLRLEELIRKFPDRTEAKRAEIFLKK